MSDLHLIIVVRAEAAPRYRDYFSARAGIAAQILIGFADARARLSSTTTALADIVVVDNLLDDSAGFIREVRTSFPRLPIILVDEQADLLMPGRADDVSIAPFEDDDLLHRIERLFQERHIETLRADSLPPVRETAQKLRQASDFSSKITVTLETVRALQYDFVAFYRQPASDEPWSLVSVMGLQDLVAVAPERQKQASLIGWVAAHGQSQIVAPDDEPNYSLVKRGRLGAGAAASVGGAEPYGVLLAGRQVPESITAEDLLMLELVCAQLAAALAQS